MLFRIHLSVSDINRWMAHLDAPSCRGDRADRMRRCGVTHELRNGYDSGLEEELPDGVLRGVFQTQNQRRGMIFMRSTPRLPVASSV